MRTFILFLVIPLVEIFLLVEIGSHIGTLWTILLIVSTAIVGARLVRLQGIASWRTFQSSISRSQLPALPLLEAAFLLVAGAFLITPGFLTDLMGFLVLIPPLRRKIIVFLLRRGIWKFSNIRPHDPDSERSIDGKFERIDE